MPRNFLDRRLQDNCLCPPLILPSYSIVGRESLRFVQLIRFEPSIRKARNLKEIASAFEADIEIVDMDDEFSGAFDSMSYSILISKGTLYSSLILDVFTHELAHLIQYALGEDNLWREGKTISQHLKHEQQTVSLSMLLKQQLFPRQPNLLQLDYFNLEDIEYLYGFLNTDSYNCPDDLFAT